MSKRGAFGVALGLLLAFGCGDDGGGSGDGDGGVGDGGNGIDAEFYPFDGGFGGECSAGDTQCNNCMDDDGDGLIDGFDPECTGAADNREDSFATGIPGDNKDAVKQDCFFDGNSGSGNDGCEIHVCCLLTGECPEDLDRRFDRARDCDDAQVQQCIDVCAPLTPPGCDCFGCCTVCDGDVCADILINPNTSPNCSQEEFNNPEVCPACTKNTECTAPDCDPAECVLCPGQTEDDLPPECTENECPNGEQVCDTSSDCGDGKFCLVGCCVFVVE